MKLAQLLGWKFKSKVWITERRFYIGDLGYEWFSGIKFKCEEGISEESLGDLILLKSNFQEKLNELTKGENLINFEIRVIKNVY